MTAPSAGPPPPIPSPLGLLVRVNLLTVWRRLLALRQQSRLLTAVILLFIVSYLGLAYWLFLVGLRFLGRFPGLSSMLIERLLFLLFAFLFVLLLLSNLVISYTNLFRNRETAFLLTQPVSTDTIYQWKFIESTLLASWAFVFLIAPFLAAYGLTRHVPWHFYAMTVVLIALFIVLPAVAGSFLAVTVARHLDRRVFQVLAVVAVLVMVAVAAWWFRPDAATPNDDSETRVVEVLDKMLFRTQFAHFPALPSYWLSASVLHWADGALRAAAFYLFVLMANALFFGLLAGSRMGRLFYDAASAVNSRASVFGRWEWFRLWNRRQQRRPYALGPAERLVNRLTWLGPDTRALMVKDARMFWRDTTQWAQSLMLFGLLGVYIFNLRHFSTQLSNPYWIHLVAYLNLGACSLNLATLTTRFVYPQFSLEGKRLWIVGLAPLGLVRVVKIKYWMSGTTALVVTLGLITLSCYMLDLPWFQTLYFAIAITVMTFTLTGLAVGLGALYPNFKEENPSKIVSGFGGTFCLVLSFLYILGSVVLLAFASPWMRTEGLPPAHAGLCLGGFAVLSLLIGWLPFQLGLRRVKTFEM